MHAFSLSLLLSRSLSLRLSLSLSGSLSLSQALSLSLSLSFSLSLSLSLSLLFSLCPSLSLSPTLPKYFDLTPSCFILLSICGVFYRLNFQIFRRLYPRRFKSNVRNYLYRLSTLRFGCHVSFDLMRRRQGLPVLMPLRVTVIHGRHVTVTQHNTQSRGPLFIVQLYSMINPINILKLHQLWDGYD